VNLSFKRRKLTIEHVFLSFVCLSELLAAPEKKKCTVLEMGLSCVSSQGDPRAYNSRHHSHQGLFQ
jgi:hypothetical protein